MSTAKAELVRVEQQLPSRPLARVEDLQAKLHELRGRANLVMPMTSMDTVLALHAVSLRAVLINADPAGGEVYQDPRFCKDHERAPTKVMLTKIMAAAGVQVAKRTRLDDRSDPHYCEVEVTLRVQDLDGTYREVIASKEMDLRPGAPETMKPEKVKGPGDRYEQKTGRMVPYDDSALADKRRHIASHAETKAIERGLRTLLSLKQKYTVEELAKPFIVPKLVPDLDPNDPDQKRALIAQATGATAQLYGPTPAVRQLAAVTDDPDIGPGEVIDHATGEVLDSAPSTAQRSATDLDDDLPPVTTAPVHVCTCPCNGGCQAEVDADLAAKGEQALGTTRCPACWPTPTRFDFARHRDVDRLELPKRPDLTVARLAEHARSKAAGGGR